MHGVCFLLLVYKNLDGRLGKLAYDSAQAFIPEEALRGDVFKSSKFLQFCELIDPPEIANVTKLGSEDGKATFLELHEHLVEDELFSVVIVDEASGSDDVELLSVAGRKIVLEFLSAKGGLLEAVINVFFIGLKQHSFAAVNACDIADALGSKTLTNEASATTKVHDIYLLGIKINLLKDLVDMLSDFCGVWIADKAHYLIVIGR